MNKDNDAIRYGNRLIRYSIIYTERKTLEIAVHPNSSIIITAPQKCDKNKIKEKVKKRAKWIAKQLKYYTQFEPRTPQKQFLNGETHLYLGKQYRLKIKTGLAEGVKLKRGYFIIAQRDKENGERSKELLNQWYNYKAQTKFDEYFELCWKNFPRKSLFKPVLKIRRMKKRWGSLSKNGTLTLNLELIKAPKECIEYVITHELCHTIHHNHSKEFYDLLGRTMPDWNKRKRKLEIMMS